MRVLYFHQHFSMPSGSAGVRSYYFAQALVNAGHEVVMVCGSFGMGNTGLTGEFRNGKRRGKVDGIELIEFALPYSNKDGFRKRTILFLRFALRSIWIALREPCDVVFATSTPLTAGIPGIFARWIRGKRFVFEVRDLWPELPRAMGVIRNPLVLAGMSALEFISYQSAHQCIGLAPGIVEGIKKRGVQPDRVFMIPNGCDFELFNASKVGAWRPPQIKEGDLIATFAGTHGTANGLGSVLDAAEVLRHRGNDRIWLVFVGDGKLKSDLMVRAKKSDLSNCLFMDAIGKSQLSGLLAGSDLALMILANVPAFYYGTSPNKFFDYIASGVPVLNNYPGWLAQIIKEHDCGLVVEPDNPEAFADALEFAEKNRQKLQEWGLRARMVAERYFDRGKQAEEFVKVIESQNFV